MTKPRLLIPLTMQFSVRYLLRTGLLARISQYAQPVIALGWDDQSLTRDLEACGAEVHRLPQVQWGRHYERVRGALNVWHQSRLASCSTAIDERRNCAQLGGAAAARRRLRRKINEHLLKRSGTVDRLLQREQVLFKENTNAWEFAAMLASLNVEAAFSLTPYLPDEEMALRICALWELPLSTAILSFDNITTRGWIPIKFDHYLLWNRYNKNELLRGYPEVKAKDITIVGPAQFDFYWDDKYVWDEDVWRSRLGLPGGRSVILYGAGPPNIVPHEPHFVAQLDEAIETGEIPGKPVILLRRHPVDPVKRWLPLLKSAGNIVYDDPWPADGPVIGRTNIRDEDIERLTSSLCYSDIHVNVSSTMTIDGSIFNHPQIGPAYDDRPGGKYDQISHELYLREHYLPITESGGLDLVKSRRAMTGAVRDALINPSHLAEGRKKLVREICTYTDGKSTVRVDEALRTFLGKESPSITAARELIVV